MISSRLLGGILVVVLGLVPAAPPEHVHEAEEHGHRSLLVHRHSQAHVSQDHASQDHDAAHQTVVHDEDAPITALDVFYTVPSVSGAIASRPAVAVITLVPPVEDEVRGAPDYADVPIHGPPRTSTSLRAPPTSTV